MITFDESSKEFIARNIADLGKATLTVGLASYFFEKLSLSWRIGITIFGVAFVVFGILIHAARKGGKP